MDNSMRDSIFCAVFGDSYGLPYEFPSKTKILGSSILPDYERRVGGRYFPTRVKIKGGSYSDDTQLLLSTLRSLSYENWYEFFKKFELPAFLSYEQGAGRATKASCKVLEKNKLPWECVKGYFDFGGNGVAMRILPHIFTDKPIEEIMFDIHLNGIFTHGNPVGLLGARLYGYIAWCIYHNKDLSNISKDRVIWGTLSANNYSNEYYSSWLATLDDSYYKEWGNTVKTICAKLDIIESGLYKDSVSSILNQLQAVGDLKGSGVNCALSSYALFLKFRGKTLQGIKEVGSFIDSDTDTLACMLGGLLGLVQGLDEDTYKLLNDYDYIDSEIKSFNDLSSPIPYLQYCGHTYKNIKDKLKNTGVGSTYSSFPFGLMTVDNIVYNDNLSDSFESVSYNIKTELGQSLKLKYYRRL